MFCLSKLGVEAQLSFLRNKVHLPKPGLHVRGVTAIIISPWPPECVPWAGLPSRLGAAQVCYYRYLRFLPGGQFLYRTSPQPLREVARSLLRPPPARGRAAEEFMQRGRFLLRVRAMPLAGAWLGGPCIRHCVPMWLLGSAVQPGRSAMHQLRLRCVLTAAVASQAARG